MIEEERQAVKYFKKQRQNYIDTQNKFKEEIDDVQYRNRLINDLQIDVNYINILLNLINKQQKEIEKRDKRLNRQFKLLVKSEKKINKQEKMINLIIEDLRYYEGNGQNDTFCIDICENKKCNYDYIGNCRECIKQYFNKKVSETNDNREETRKENKYNSRDDAENIQSK